MTMATQDRRSISESQSKALYDRETPYREVRWSSENARAKRRSEPPAGVHAKLAWFRQTLESEIPAALHTHGTDDSEWGAPPFSGAFMGWLVSPHTTDDDGNLIKPMQSAFSWLKSHRPSAWSTLMALMSQGHWDWEKLAGVPFYRVLHTKERVLVRVMDREVLEIVLDSGLDALWREFTYHREAT